MRICIISPEFPPSPGSGIADCAKAAADNLAAAGHEVHVVTNRAVHGSEEFRDTVELWRDGNLTIHRLDLFDAERRPSRSLRLCELDTSQFPDHDDLWAHDTSNLAAAGLAGFVASLHAVVRFDVIEVPERLASAFYIIRHRNAGRRSAYPPVCVIGHTSTREALRLARDVGALGRERQRELMAREEYCLQHADALATSSGSLMARYEAVFGAALPGLRAVIPHYVDVDAAAAGDELPGRLREDGRFLLAVGRLEPRNGSDLMVRAFARIAADYPDLRLVLMAHEARRAGEPVGESVDSLVERILEAPHRERVLQLVGLPRPQVLAAMREAAAFVHSAPADHCSNAVLEAMAVGARCVVSDTGGHRELIENGTGLLFRSGDLDSLVAALERVLDDPELGRRLGPAARQRVSEIADRDTVTSRKVALFERIVDAEREASTVRADRDSDEELPGSGIVVVDAAGAADVLIAPTIESVAEATIRASGWRVAVLLDDKQRVDAPRTWSRCRCGDPPPWRDSADSDYVVWVRAGTRFDHGRMASLVHLVQRSPRAAGAFAWLRPPNLELFPYAQDGGFHDLLTEGALIPPVMCMTAARVKAITDLLGLDGPSARACAMLAAATLASDSVFLHTGDVIGDYYDRLPIVTRSERERALGFAELLGLLPAHLLTTHSRSMLFTKGEVVIHTAVDPGLLTEVHHLRQIHDEHMRLKNSRIVRAFRALGLLSLARRVLPWTKKYLGSGRPS